MYRINERVKYTDIGIEKKVGISTIVNYFQNCTLFHSEDIGVGLKQLEEYKRSWLICAWNIEVDRYPEFCENISIGTSAYEFKGIYGFRNFNIIDSNGVEIARADSIWFYIDQDTKKPTRIMERDASPYGIEEKLNMKYASRKIPLPEKMTKKNSFPVLKYQIDTNNHMNNEKYIEVAEEYIPENYKVIRVRADYKVAAVEGDIIYPMVSMIDNKCTVALCNEKESPYVVIEFTLENK